MTKPLRCFAIVAALSVGLGCAAGGPSPMAVDPDSGEKDAGEKSDTGVVEEFLTFDVQPLDSGTDLGQAAETGDDAGADGGAADAESDGATDDAGGGGDAATPGDQPPGDVGCRAMCNGFCVDTDTDTSNCGGCGVDCTVRPGVDPMRVRCVAGQCDYANGCQAGRAHCSANPLDGCESLVNTVLRCGTCTSTCADPTPLCAMVAGVPGGFACTSGCDANAPSRCGSTCVNTMIDPRNCGRCGNVCTAGAQSTASCVMGQCRVTCVTGYGDCDGNPANGCELLLRSNLNNCGMCANVCPAGANGTPVCSNSACSFTCAAGRGNCDAVLTNGCEADLRTSNMHCGACGIACAERTNGVNACVGGGCVLTCNQGFGNCDNNPANGCEVDVRTSPIHCGMCARRCSAQANAAAACVNEACAITCNAGFGNCNGNNLDGCEVNVNTDPAHCGMCGMACPTPANTRATCTTGRCGTTCNTGFGDCDGNTANGCEADTRVSSQHCGACGSPCAAPSNSTAQCTASRCVITCDDGYALSGSVCVRATPRVLSPMPFGMNTSRRPRVRLLLPRGQDGAEVEICRDRNCTQVATSFAFTGNLRECPIDLAPGGYYVRARGRIGASAVSTFGVATPFQVLTTRYTGIDATWGLFLDVQGDGNPDVAIGAPATNVVQVRNGPSVTTSVAQTLTGSTGAGVSIAALGDVNGDGYGDLAVGSSANSVAVYHGGASSLVTTPAVTLTPPGGVAGFGLAVAAAGDVNGDGYSDVLVGAPTSNRVFLYLGGASGVSPTALATLIPNSSGMVGISVAGVGDVDADGFSDVVIGSDGANAAWFYRGSAAGLGAPIALTSAGAAGFGRAVAGAGDLNGDGYPDVVVGAYNSSAVYYFPGRVDGIANAPSGSVTPPGGAAQFGWSTDGAGDVNGDGVMDLLVGTASSGQVFVFSGAVAGLPNVVLTSFTPGGDAGRAIRGVGDVDRNGLGDFVAGSPSTARSYYYRGMSTPVLSTTMTLTSSGLGTSIASLWSPRGSASAVWFVAPSPFHTDARALFGG